MILHERLYAIELKTRLGRLSKGYWTHNARGSPVWREGQEQVFPRLEKAGMTIAVCRSLEAVIGTLRGWEIPMRRLS